jgi:hypothetical protein
MVKQVFSLVGNLATGIVGAVAKPLDISKSIGTVS